MNWSSWTRNEFSNGNGSKESNRIQLLSQWQNGIDESVSALNRNIRICGRRTWVWFGLGFILFEQANACEHSETLFSFVILFNSAQGMTREWRVKKTCPPKRGANMFFVDVPEEANYTAEVSHKCFLSNGANMAPMFQLIKRTKKDTNENEECEDEDAAERIEIIPFGEIEINCTCVLDGICFWLVCVLPFLQHAKQPGASCASVKHCDSLSFACFHDWMQDSQFLDPKKLDSFYSNWGFATAGANDTCKVHFNVLRFFLIWLSSLFGHKIGTTHVFNICD